MSVAVSQAAAPTRTREVSVCTGANRTSATAVCGVGRAARHNPVCCELFERLIAKGKTTPAAYGAVARKLVPIINGVMKSLTTFNSSSTCS